jgi:5'-nucleotidase
MFKPTSIIVAAVAATLASAHAQYSITVLHNNDGESRLTSYTDALAEYGGVARFATMLSETRSFYQGLNHGVVSVFAGDTFLAGPQFQASLNSNADPSMRTYYDALAISRIGYDASVIGNHEFDFGPDVLADFITEAQTHNPTTYLSANLNFAGESALQAHVTAGRLAPSKTVTVNTAAGPKKIGIIGATTETLPFVSSPGGVTVNPVVAAVNAQVTALRGGATPVDHVILVGHLQGLSTDNALVASLVDGIDLIVAGGGDELLRNASATSPLSTHGASAPGNHVDTGFIPGESPATLSFATNNYPLTSTVTNLAGKNVPIVTTGGNYGYLGRVTLNFDANGALTVDASSGPQRVASTTADATHGVVADTNVQAETVTPVANFVAGLAATNIATTRVQLLHGGSPTIRSRETNLGNIVADGILAAAQGLASAFNVDSPQIALVNGGGIRANVAAGNVSLLSTFNVSPFGNFVSIVEDVKLSDIRLLLENAYSRTSDGPGAGIDPVGSDGRFAHLSGIEVEYDITVSGFRFDTAGNVTTAANRVRGITIGTTEYMRDGLWLVPDPSLVTFDIATLTFLANGGDQYFRTVSGGSSTYLSQLYSFTNLGVTDQNALQSYITTIAGGNPATDISMFKPEYAVQQSITGGRISTIPEPSSVLIALCGGIAVLMRRRNR